MVTALNRITDIGIGGCAEVTVQITGSPDTITEYLQQARLLDLHAWVCSPCGAGIGPNLMGSTTVFDNNLNIHRIMDLQLGCTIAVVVTGAAKTYSGT